MTFFCHVVIDTLVDKVKKRSKKDSSSSQAVTAISTGTEWRSSVTISATSTLKRSLSDKPKPPAKRMKTNNDLSFLFAENTPQLPSSCNTSPIHSDSKPIYPESERKESDLSKFLKKTKHSSYKDKSQNCKRQASLELIDLVTPRKTRKPVCTDEWNSTLASPEKPAKGDICRCTYCDFICIEYADLREHVNETHKARQDNLDLDVCERDPPEDPNVMFQCNVCDFSSRRKAQTRQHIKIAHHDQYKTCHRVEHLRNPDTGEFDLKVTSVVVNGYE